jgi:hypothetical protein
MIKIHINSFVKRQTPESEFSHFDVARFADGWERLAVLVRAHFGLAVPGYRNGVILIPLNDLAWLFMSGVTTLTEGAELQGSFRARVPGEKPRKSVLAVDASKLPAKTVDIVLYASTVLSESGENELPAEPGNWEIISINASPTEGTMPINPDVLMHNHFGSDGGTATNLSDSEFVAMLRESFEYWRDKAMCGPKKVQ